MKKDLSELIRKTKRDGEQARKELQEMLTWRSAIETVKRSYEKIIKEYEGTLADMLDVALKSINEPTDSSTDRVIADHIRWLEYDIFSDKHLTIMRDNLYRTVLECERTAAIRWREKLIQWTNKN